ncbi:MAG TPA: HipA family kinase [Haliangiales bacterium]|nr:HipA family kinase [Haliangiales bacterium]
MPLRTVAARRYVTPLREGGSLPAIVEADDLGTYVLKFRGAGQGPKALVAEVIAGEIGRALGLAVPEIVLMEVDPVLGRSEPDYEIRTLLKSSGGLNLAIDYLPGSIAFDPAGARPDPALAAKIVWFDALVTNVDRTARNTNLLWWHGRLHLIDHGAALYFQHGGAAGAARGRAPFPQIREHVLLPFAGDVAAADAALAPRVPIEVIREVVGLVPEEWLGDPPREAYVDFLARRLAAPREFVEEAARARDEL